jgi:hypothetical protein
MKTKSKHFKSLNIEKVTTYSVGNPIPGLEQTPI